MCVGLVLVAGMWVVEGRQSRVGLAMAVEVAEEEAPHRTQIRSRPNRCRGRLQAALRVALMLVRWWWVAVER